MDISALSPIELNRLYNDVGELIKRRQAVEKMDVDVFMVCNGDYNKACFRIEGDGSKAFAQAKEKAIALLNQATIENTPRHYEISISRERIRESELIAYLGFNSLL